MVANNIGHAEDSNRSGKFHGSFTQSSTEPQIQPNLFERMNNCNELSPRIFAAQNEFSLEISSRINAIKEYVAESSSRSKQHMPRKFAEMSSKFRFGQECVEKLGISSNFVDTCLHYFCTILHSIIRLTRILCSIIWNVNGVTKFFPFFWRPFFNQSPEQDGVQTAIY